MEFVGDFRVENQCLMGGNTTPKVRNIVCPGTSLSATLGHSVISKILGMGSHFWANIKRHNGFILEKSIHQYIFLHGYKSI